MRKFGLIGYPLGHSFSQKYFTEKFKRESIPDCVYLNFQLDNIGLLEDLLNDSELCGLNVTIPYKTQVIRYLSDIDNDAAQVGAVNVIRISGGKGPRRLKGFNSDIYGFRESITPHLRKRGEKALILGTGGASMAVGYVFRALGIDFLKASILGEPDTIKYNEITGDLLESYRIIVNTTPLGMYPDTSASPDIPYHLLSEEHLLYDLVYNPEITEFMAKGKERGCKVIGGLGMLHLQAEKSWSIWNDPAV